MLMPATLVTPVSNRLIDGLPRTQRAAFRKRCEAVDMVFGSVFGARTDPIGYVYFPLTGFISLVITVAGHPPMELGLIGNEGMLGATLALGTDTAPLRAVVQGSGTALRMSAAQFRCELADSAALRRTLGRYLYVSLAQLAQTAACTRFHDIESRLARWLLMTDDRAHADHLHLTHQFLADMLGVRRSGVTIAARRLHRKLLIRYSRGEITVLDRPGLEAAACECYRADIADYERLLAGPVRTARAAL